MNTCQYDNEGMTFLHDDSNNNNYYQPIEAPKNNNNNNNKSYHQQGDDFRPTFYNPFEIKHRRRTSRAQFKVLEKTFLENPKPNAAIRRWLAQKLVMTPRGVQVWFQNRRAKEKTVNLKKPSVTTTTTVTTPSTEMMFHSEPLVKQPSNHSSSSCSSYDELLLNSSLSSSPVYNPVFIPTPMTRTLSYPPFYHSDASNADEEELLMTPVTPFVDHQFQQQQVYDYPIFYPQQQQQQQQWPMNHYYENNNTMMRRMYSDNMLEDQRRYSTCTTIEQDKFFQSNEVFRRLSEPIFDHPQQQQQDLNQQFNYQQFDQFDLLARSNTRYSM